MEQPIDLLPRVAEELERRRGNLKSISDATGIPYDTVLRIRSGEGDPGYAKVRHLYEYLFRVQLQPASKPAAITTRKQKAEAT